MTTSTPSDLSTQPYQPVAAATTDPTPAERRPVAFVAGPTPTGGFEVRDLVARRLRLISALFLSAYALFLLRDLTITSRTEANFQSSAIAVAFVLQGILAGFIWGRPGMSLPRLRLAECGCMAVAWALLAVIQFAHLSGDNPRAWLDGAHPLDVQIMIGNTWVLPWFAMIATYATIMPNTWRRCMVMVGTMAVLALAVAVVALAVNPRMAGRFSAVIPVEMAIWIAIGVAIAVYGCYRLESLRQEAQVARQFGQYRLTRPIGSGGMGEVYLAEHLLLRRPSVVKLIRPERARDPVALRRFEREVRIMATLTHWNTVEIFDYGHAADGTFYYVMEHLPGLNLEELVAKHGPLPPGRVVHLVRQVCAALREAHGIGLIHRDVKPGNVIVCERGGVGDVAKLLDFGLVQAVGADGGDRLTVEGSLMGTPAFMSPEQAAGRGDAVGPASDVYSLGATAYFLLTGHAPFVRETSMEVIAAHLLEPVPSLRAERPELPEDLEACVLRCLEKEPAKRFTNVADLEKSLRGCACAAEWSEETGTEWWRKAGK